MRTSYEDFCGKCGTELGTFGCDKCQKKRDRIKFAVTIVLTLALLGLYYGSQVAMFDDWRCIFGQCRIMK